MQQVTRSQNCSMQVQVYLRQVLKLKREIDERDHAAKALSREAAQLQSPSAGGCGGSDSRPTEASFVRKLDCSFEIEDEVKEKREQLALLLRQVWGVIDALPCVDEREVLRYRYLEGLQWQEIHEKLNVSPSTAYAWHSRGLTHVVLPPDAIWL